MHEYNIEGTIGCTEVHVTESVSINIIPYDQQTVYVQGTN